MRAAIMPCLYHILGISLCLINSGYASYFIDITPDKLLIGISQDVSLGCHFAGTESSSPFTSISRIRILKESGPGNYIIVAEVRENESEAHNLGVSLSAVVTGHIGNVSSSYILISWKLATTDILGSYRCDVIGYKANEDVVVEKTPVIDVMERPVTIQDALDLAIKRKAYIQQRIEDQKEYCDSQVAAAERNATARLGDTQTYQTNSNQDFHKSYNAEIAKLTANINRLKDTGVFLYWPEGTYGLLMPNSGCPDNVGAQWGYGYRKFHTESTDRNYDNVSDSSHLPNPTMERIDIDNFMYQHFCVSTVRSAGPVWPRGSYCINRVGGSCPSGLGSGFIKWQDEITNSKSSTSGFLPDGDYKTNSTIIYYCCRADGPADHPVYLPKSRPFYLYRYNGKCQEVVEMQTSPGYMTFDTDNGKGDAYENNYHPDGNIDNVRIEFCYYS